VHRLDRDTSGLLLLAHGALMAKHLTRAFADQAVRKTYLAVVADVEGQEGQLNLPLRKILQGGEGRMVVAKADDPEAQSAVTDFSVLAHGAGGVLVGLQPRTGRTHQLRVHCTQAFGGIYGDSKYGQAKDRTRGLMLHAWQADLEHPQTGEPLRLEAAPPPAFLEALARLDLRVPEQWSPL